MIAAEQGAGQRYFSEFLSAPDMLTEIFPMIDRLIDDRGRSSYSYMQRRRNLLEGTASPAVFARFIKGVYPEFPDCREVQRTHTAIITYLERLIAPDELAAAREPISDLLKIDDCSEIANDLCKLNAVAPCIVTALLELRVGEAEHMLFNHLIIFRTGVEREALDDCRHLPHAMTSIRIAFLLRCQAMICAARIHAPFGWSVLDDLERLGTGGCLRVSTLVARVERELALLDNILAVYGKSASSANLTLSGLQSSVDSIGIEPRARVQHAIWRGRHGDELECILSGKIDTVKARVDRLRAHLKAFRAYHKPNEVVGNLGRANTGVQLYLAAREAVAWTRQTVETGQSSGSVAISTALRARVRNLTTPLQFQLPKLRPSDTATIDELFLVLRFAYLQDNEALPQELRFVEDPETGRRARVKTHGHAADVLGRRYSFAEQWAAWQQSMQLKQARLPATATPQQRCQSYQIDLAAKREALAVVKRPTRKATRDAFARRDALRASILGGFANSR